MGGARGHAQPGLVRGPLRRRPPAAGGEAFAARRAGRAARACRVGHGAQGPPPPVSGPAAPPAPPAAPPAPDYVPPEEILFRARLLISQARYWDAIQVLESTVPQMEPRRNQHKGRILLAKAYAKNPNWVRRAEEYLHQVVREDPDNVDAHYELGRLYKQVGHAGHPRAQAAFRRVVELKPEHREAAAELGLTDGPGPGGGLLKRIFRRGKAS